MRVQRAAVWTGHHVAVVAEEVQPLDRQQDRLEASVALKERIHTVSLRFVSCTIDFG